MQNINADKGNKSDIWGARLLEDLALVKAPLILIYTDGCQSLVEEMFDVVFQSVHTTDSSKIHAAFVELLHSVLLELEHVWPSLIAIIFQQLLGNVNSASYQLAKQLLTTELPNWDATVAEILQQASLRRISGDMKSKSRKTANLRKKTSRNEDNNNNNEEEEEEDEEGEEDEEDEEDEDDMAEQTEEDSQSSLRGTNDCVTLCARHFPVILRELGRIASPLFHVALPVLERELCAESIDLRFRATTTLGKVLSALPLVPGKHISSDNPSEAVCWTWIFARCADAAARIRLQAVEQIHAIVQLSANKEGRASASYYSNNNNNNSFDAEDGILLTSPSPMLAARGRNKKPQTNTNTNTNTNTDHSTQPVPSLGRQLPVAETSRALIARCRDADYSVRIAAVETALQWLSTTFALAQGSRLEVEEEEEDVHRLSSLPSQLLSEVVLRLRDKRSDVRAHCFAALLPCYEQCVSSACGENGLWTVREREVQFGSLPTVLLRAMAQMPPPSLTASHGAWELWQLHGWKRMEKSSPIRLKHWRAFLRATDKHSMHLLSPLLQQVARLQQCWREVLEMSPTTGLQSSKKEKGGGGSQRKSNSRSLEQLQDLLVTLCSGSGSSSGGGAPKTLPAKEQKEIVAFLGHLSQMKDHKFRQGALELMSGSVTASHYASGWKSVMARFVSKHAALLERILLWTAPLLQDDEWLLLLREGESDALTTAHGWEWLTLCAQLLPSSIISLAPQLMQWVQEMPTSWEYMPQVLKTLHYLGPLQRRNPQQHHQHQHNHQHQQSGEEEAERAAVYAAFFVRHPSAKSCQGLGPLLLRQIRSFCCTASSVALAKWSVRCWDSWMVEGALTIREGLQLSLQRLHSFQLSSLNGGGDSSSSSSSSSSAHGAQQALLAAIGQMCLLQPEALLESEGVQAVELMEHCLGMVRSGLEASEEPVDESKKGKGKGKGRGKSQKLGQGQVTTPPPPTATLLWVLKTCSRSIADVWLHPDYQSFSLPLLHQVIATLTQLLSACSDDEGEATWPGSLLDRQQLRLATSIALCRIFRHGALESQCCSPDLYVRLSLAAQDVVCENREIFMRKCFHFATKYTLPSHYLAALVLLAVDPEKSNVTLAKGYLSRFIQLKRQMLQQIKQQASTSPPQGGGVIMSHSEVTRVTQRLLPENILPWLIFLIAHHPDFEEDAPSFAETQKYLQFFLDCIWIHHHHSGDHPPLPTGNYMDSNYILLRYLMDFTKCAADVTDPGNHAIHQVAEIGLLLLQVKAEGRRATQAEAAPPQIHLPTRCYTRRQDVASQQEALSQQFLPASFQIRQHHHHPAGSTTAVSGGTTTGVRGGRGKRVRGLLKSPPRQPGHSKRSRKGRVPASDAESEESILSSSDSQDASSSEAEVIPLVSSTRSRSQTSRVQGNQQPHQTVPLKEAPPPTWKKDPSSSQPQKRGGKRTRL
jgi:hypothetical protein